MDGDVEGDAPVEMRVDAAGYAGRTPKVLARERGLWAQMSAELAGGTKGDDAGLGTAEPEGGSAPSTLTLAQLDAGLTSGARRLRPPAAFVAGRCHTTDAASQRIDVLLHEVVDGVDMTDPGAKAVALVEAAMSLVLRGDEDAADVLRTLVAEDGPGTMADWFAAYYLAQLDDPCGWPKMVEELGAGNGFTRLMAARHLLGFLPYDGTTVGGQKVDVRARMTELRKDRDELVAQEIPGLLAELDD